MQPAEAIQIAALAAVAVDDFDEDYFYRRVFRWYSEKFHTPLHEVYELPFEFVLQHYFEVQYEAMDDQRRAAEVDRLKLNKEQRWKRMLKEEAEKADADEFAQFVAAEEQARIKKELEQAEKKKLVVAEIPNQMSLRSDQSPSPLIQASSPPPDIKMEFVDEAELEELIKDSSITPPK